jgi:putative NIF3 family GTP cyclohydrolase 1 type 2
LRHHPISEAIEAGAPALIDAGHFATEWPWLGQAAGLLVSDLAAIGASVEVEVSSINTDAWSNV